MAYNANTDYLALINKANATGDYASAAKYEAQRNEKIAAMNAAGANTNGYTATNNYVRPAASTNNQGYSTGAAYDEKVDYQKLIDNAVSSGNTVAAAQYERQRNAKIAAMNAAGTNTNNLRMSDTYIKPQEHQTPQNLSWVEASYATGANKDNLNIDYQKKMDDIVNSSLNSGNWKAPGVLTDSAA